MITSKEVREKYLEFFQSKQHDIIPSASLIPVNDPTLLWINAGVAPLKKYFDGSEVPSSPRLANAQKCIRTNDIDNVGFTARHHTLFEMLGNWSIGDYFKEEAVAWAWEFLTDHKWLGLDPSRLYATVYPEDTQTPDIWRKQPNFQSDHIIPLEDNFWDIGAGPCGPCTEIFYDRGESYLDIPEDDPENFPGGENERYLEIWNLVFSEFNHMPDDTYEPLPRKNIDTGMGLERMVSVLQDTATNFETDLFLPIIQKISEISQVPYKGQASFKVIADHVRAVTFAIGDGALPSNEGRGYILRRLIRRAVMHGQKLGIQQNFLRDLVPIVVSIMGDFYPEITTNADFIMKVIGSEEEKFHETIHGGEALLNELFETMAINNETVVSGVEAFKLYDTYGFPLELTMEYAQEKGYSVDADAFEREMSKQKERARSARNVEESMNIQSDIYTSISDASLFVGYEALETSGTLTTLVVSDEKVTTATAGQTANAFFSQTPFYAEMGGQVADTGEIYTVDGEHVASVTQVKKAPNGQPMHQLTIHREMNINSKYVLKVDIQKRHKIIKNHTATHLLHQALKDVLGEHANQAGSLVTPTHLRFDFTHFGQVTKDELKQMERIVNEKIWASLPVVTVETTIDKAKEMGAMALFGEKYGEVVRVVNIGGYSIELCGGIHVDNTANLGIFKIVSESGIGAGTRRIEAVTGQEAYELSNNFEDTLIHVSQLLKVQSDKVVSKVESVLSDNKYLSSQVESLKAQALQSQASQLFENVVTVNGLRVISTSIDGKEMNDLRGLADSWKQKDYSDVFVVASNNDGKVNLLVAVNKVANEKGIEAGTLVKQLAGEIGGGGGGRRDMAQAGGSNPAGIPVVLEKVLTLL